MKLLRAMSDYIDPGKGSALFCLLVIVLGTLIGGPALAVPPALDLDADDSRVSGVGFYNSADYCDCGVTRDGGPLPVVDNDVQVTDTDGSSISSIEITIMNPHATDILYVDDPLFTGTYTDGTLSISISSVLSHQTAENVLRAVRWVNNRLQTVGCANAPDACSLRLISIRIRDENGEWSNEPVLSIEPREGVPALRGIIFLTVRDALSSVTLNGSVVSASGNYLSVDISEIDDIHVLEFDPEGVYEVNVDHPGYSAISRDNLGASLFNDPSQPVVFELCQPADADADIVPDGQLNAGDLVVATQIVLGLRAGTVAEACHGDLNGDGDLDVGDLVGIIQAVQAAP